MQESECNVPADCRGMQRNSRECNESRCKVPGESRGMQRNRRGLTRCKETGKCNGMAGNAKGKNGVGAKCRTFSALALCGQAASCRVHDVMQPISISIKCTAATHCAKCT